MTILMLGPEQKEKIKQVMEKAAARPVPLKVMREMAETGRRGRKWKTYDIEIPMGYLCAYSVEMQTIGPYRHLSISVKTPGSLPNVPAIQAIIKEFGFENFDLLNKEVPRGARVWLEEFMPGHHAINFVQPILDVKGSA